MPCGYDAQRAHEEALSSHARELARARRARGSSRSNASAYFSRPGPRLIDGLELLAHILHPEQVPEAPGEALAVELPSAVEPAQGRASGAGASRVRRAERARCR